MDSKSVPCTFLPLLLAFLLPFALQTQLFSSTDTISLGQSLSGNQTTVSKGGSFELGFFTPGKSNKYYIGIWYKKLPGQTVIWVANRRASIYNPSTAKLKVTQHGNLILLNSTGAQVWSSNSTGSSSNATSAVLLDTGNLVLTSGGLSMFDVTWQSFDHPTDTWMPGGWLGVNKVTSEYQSITCWASADDPAPGPFSQSMDLDGSNQYVILWNDSNIYWSSGLWNGKFFSDVPGTAEHTVFNFTFTDNKTRKYAMYTITDSSVITRYMIDPWGQGKQWMWLSDRQQWQTVFTQPLVHCDVYSLCGPFGVCDTQSTTSLCRCPDGFRPASKEQWELNVWNSGCLRRTPLQCGKNGSLDGFLMMSNMKLPSNAQTLKVATADECELACLNDCSCNAYSYSGGCSIWTGDLRNIQQLYGDDSGGGNIYVRIAASDLPNQRSPRNLALIVSLSAVACVLCILLFLSGLLLVHHRRKVGKNRNVEGSLIRFSYGDMQRATKNFTEKIGDGGFGAVFRGTLRGSTEVAVKMLQGVRQGEKQFRAEVSTLGVIQHVNLVRLCGFCSEENRRLLVYEYMPGGSLDSHLHEACRECIIHCDIKPENILLDADFHAKVADFGMAKLVGRDFSRVLTTMRGTIGYLAPEWISGLPVTPKVDVYSFGMMLFELISGRRNTAHSVDGSKRFYPSLAAMRVIDGNERDILDPRLEGHVEIEELRRFSRVACWCIQDSEANRPSMGLVVKILEGVVEVNVPPLPRSLLHLMEDQDSSVSYFSHAEQDPKETSFIQMKLQKLLDGFNSGKVPCLSDPGPFCGQAPNANVALPTLLLNVTFTMIHAPVATQVKITPFVCRMPSSVLLESSVP